jgi:hypothetical protein
MHVFTDSKKALRDAVTRPSKSHFDPVAPRAFSKIDQKLRSISIIPEGLFHSISARLTWWTAPANSI